MITILTPRMERNLWIVFVISLLLAVVLGFWLGISVASLSAFP
jgi:hypothetical protein